MSVRKLILARPRGFCAGVDRAIDVVQIALELFPGPVYVRKEIVHNRYVIESLAKRGAIFVDELDAVPDGAVVIFSAHGVSPEVRRQAAAKRLQVIDATCPLVTKVHLEAVRYAKEGRSIILVGHSGHEEVAGTMGEAPGSIQLVGTVEEAERVEVPDPESVGVITQTTLGVEDANVIINVLRRRFPKLITPSSGDICYATQNRQDAVKFMAPQCDLVIVVGSPNSSNSNRLREVAQTLGVEARMVDDASELCPEWLQGHKRIGVSAGASAPEVLVMEVIARLQELGAKRVSQLQGKEEGVTFPLPKGLAAAG